MKMNRVIKNLIFSDLYLFTAGGLITPVFAIFLTNNIQGGNVKIAGYAAAIYLVVKSLVQIPVAYYLDKNLGEKDDLYCIILGSLIIAGSMFGYVFARLPWHIYLLQFFYALGISINFPGYYAIFSRHLSRGKEAFSWSMHDSLADIGAGIAGAFGGIVVFKFGFGAAFICAGCLSIISAILPIFIFHDIFDKDGRVYKIEV